jgi:hypothetical protein
MARAGAAAFRLRPAWSAMRKIADSLETDASERNEGDCGYYYNAGCQHENFYGIKARKYWLFRHGYFLKHPTPMDKEVRNKGEIVIERSDVRIATATFKTLAHLAKCGKKVEMLRGFFVLSKLGGRGRRV